ncbi:MAG: hypothetical protein J7M21_02135 [Planctomycetes bacterium]|nr:hypothetical protein [Planctomycetota bacterium]
MTKTYLAMLLSFLVTFAAGGAVGMLAAPEMPTPASHGYCRGQGQGQGQGLGDELHLTAEQREQMRRIWSQVMGMADRRLRERMMAIRREREKALEDLLTDSQRAMYDQINADFQRRMRQVGEEWRALVDKAVQQTKAILTPEQVRKYEEFRMRRLRGHRPGPPYGPHHGPPGMRPGSRPAGHPGRRGGPPPVAGRDPNGRGRPPWPLPPGPAGGRWR